MRGSRRVSVRLSDDRLARLQRVCQETGCNVSHVVRQALDAFLPSESGAGSTNSGPPRRLSPPEQIFPLVAKYRAWGRGDPRRELNRIFVELLAASFACKQLYPRTASIVDGYLGLLQLCRFFGLE